MTVTINLTAADGATNTVTLADPVVNSSSYPDGAANAPTGTPIFPHLLDINSPSTQMHGRAIAARPAWKVPGVDYHVGIDRGLYPTNAALSDPATISMAGVTVNTSTHTVTVNGSNVTIEGYDFSLAGGWMIEYAGGSNLTIKNNNFVVGSNAHTAIWSPPGGGTGLTITQNEIDGGTSPFSGGAGAQNGVLALNARGTTTVTYNYITNAPGEDIVLCTTNNASGDVWVVQYNAIGNGGAGWTTTGLHGDWIQTYGGSGASTASMTMDYNLFFQFIGVTGATSGPRTQGLSLWSAGGNGGLVETYSCDNNVFIGTGVSPSNNGPFVNIQIIAVPKCLSDNATIEDNYFDPTLYTSGGSFTGCAFWIGSDYGTGSPSQGAQKGTFNGVFPPSALFSSAGLPSGNTSIVDGSLIAAGAELHLGAS